MPKFIDLTGKKFNRLTVVDRVRNNKHNHIMWNCICECGVLTIANGVELKKGLKENKGGTKSCGCLKRERFTKDGRTNLPTHEVWRGLNKRCYEPKTNGYCNYGGRGITVCDEWREDPFSFYSWCKESGWNKDLQVDRIDPDGNYEPSNCRIVTRSQNMAGIRKLKRNKSGYIGVYWNKGVKKWRASLRSKGNDIHIGYFDSLKDAVEKRDNYITKNNLPHRREGWRGSE